MELSINRSACNGTGLCERICPQLFEVVDGVARLKQSHVPKEAEALCREAAKHCPTRAIWLIEPRRSPDPKTDESGSAANMTTPERGTT